MELTKAAEKVAVGAATTAADAAVIAAAAAATAADAAAITAAENKNAPNKAVNPDPPTDNDHKRNIINTILTHDKIHKFIIKHAKNFTFIPQYHKELNANGNELWIHNDYPMINILRSTEQNINNWMKRYLEETPKTAPQMKKLLLEHKKLSIKLTPPQFDPPANKKYVWIKCKNDSRENYAFCEWAKVQDEEEGALQCIEFFGKIIFVGASVTGDENGSLRTAWDQLMNEIEIADRDNFSNQKPPLAPAGLWTTFIRKGKLDNLIKVQNYTVDGEEDLFKIISPLLRRLVNKGKTPIFAERGLERSEYKFFEEVDDELIDAETNVNIDGIFKKAEKDVPEYVIYYNTSYFHLFTYIPSEEEEMEPMKMGWGFKIINPNGLGDILKVGTDDILKVGTDSTNDDRDALGVWQNDKLISRGLITPNFCVGVGGGCAHEPTKPKTGEAQNNIDVAKTREQKELAAAALLQVEEAEKHREAVLEDKVWDGQPQWFSINEKINLDEISAHPLLVKFVNDHKELQGIEGEIKKHLDDNKTSIQLPSTKTSDESYTKWEEKVTKVNTGSYKGRNRKPPKFDNNWENNKMMKDALILVIKIIKHFRTDHSEGALEEFEMHMTRLLEFKVDQTFKEAMNKAIEVPSNGIAGSINHADLHENIRAIITWNKGDGVKNKPYLEGIYSILTAELKRSYEAVMEIERPDRESLASYLIHMKNPVSRRPLTDSQKNAARSRVTNVLKDVGELVKNLKGGGVQRAIGQGGGGLPETDTPLKKRAIQNFIAIFNKTCKISNLVGPVEIAADDAPGDDVSLDAVGLVPGNCLGLRKNLLSEVDFDETDHKKWNETFNYIDRWNYYYYLKKRTDITEYFKQPYIYNFLPPFPLADKVIQENLVRKYYIYNKLVAPMQHAQWVTFLGANETKLPKITKLLFNEMKQHDYCANYKIFYNIRPSLQEVKYNLRFLKSFTVGPNEDLYKNYEPGSGDDDYSEIQKKVDTLGSKLGDYEEYSGYLIRPPSQGGGKIIHHKKKVKKYTNKKRNHTNKKRNHTTKKRGAKKRKKTEKMRKFSKKK